MHAGYGLLKNDELNSSIALKMANDIKMKGLMNFHITNDQLLM